MDGPLTISTTWGTSDPTKATIPFHLARGAKQAGIAVRVVVAGDSTELIRSGGCGHGAGQRRPATARSPRFRSRQQDADSRLKRVC